MQEERAIRFKELKEMIGVSRSTIQRWEKEGTFPKHHQLGANSVFWLKSEVDAWITNRIKRG